MNESEKILEVLWSINEHLSNIELFGGSTDTTDIENKLDKLLSDLEEIKGILKKKS